MYGSGQGRSWRIKALFFPGAVLRVNGGSPANGFNQLYTQRVTLEGMIRKPDMVLPGLTCPKQQAVDDVADATVRCLLRAVPAAVPRIAFLSGGQSAELASARLNAMNVRFKSPLPWVFSFARSIQQPALEIWRGEEAHVLAAQQALYHRAKCNSAARRGQYTAGMEKEMGPIIARK